VKTDSEVTEYIVTGGFVEISGTNASVLAEQALPKGEVTSDIVDGLIADAAAAAEAASADDLDAANKRLADTKALLDLV